MPTEQKIKIVDILTQKFQNSSSVYLTKYTGMSVAQATDLRAQFRESDVSYYVAKNTLAKLAAKQAG